MDKIHVVHNQLQPHVHQDIIYHQLMYVLFVLLVLLLLVNPNVYQQDSILQEANVLHVLHLLLNHVMQIV